MSETREVWVSRNPGLLDVVLTDYEPEWRGDMDCFDYRRDGQCSAAGLHSFKAITGLSLKPGQCLKIKLTAEVLEGEA